MIVDKVVLIEDEINQTDLQVETKDTTNTNNIKTTVKL
jgi:hypothetical protein